MDSIWQPIETAPKTGTIIEVSYGDGSNPSDNTLAIWSERPVCMAGTINGGCAPGWATTIECICDTNLPMDEPNLWREYL